MLEGIPDGWCNVSVAVTEAETFVVVHVRSARLLLRADHHFKRPALCLCAANPLNPHQ